MRVLGAAALALLLGPAAVDGQLPRVGAVEAGLGDHSVASARGFTAIAVNPAGLGLGSGRPTAAASVRFGAGLEPVGLGEIARWEGEAIPGAVRGRWVDRIRRAGTEHGGATAAATPLALAVGRLGVQLSTVAAGRVAVNGDAAELVLFGNVGRTGEPRAFDLEGSRIDGWASSTLAVAWGAPAGRVRGGILALGATAKLTAGHALLLGRDAGSSLDAGSPDVRLAFPVVTVAPGEGAFGSALGLGLDLGAAWEREGLALGLAVRNVVSTFGWELDRLVYRPGTALFEGDDDVASDFEPRPADEAPGVLRRAALDFAFGPSVEIGVAAPLGPASTLAASAERTFGHDDGVAPTVRVGAGVESRAWERVPVRAHASVVERSLRVGMGATLVLGGLRVSGAGSATVGTTEREGWIGALSVSWAGAGPAGG